MKTTSPLLAISCFLIFFAFTTKPFYASAEPVVDTDGEPLQWFTNYYVRIIILGPRRAGLGLDTLNNQSCPLYVSYETESYGFPVSFSPVLSKLPFVTTSTELNIHTSAQTTCIETLVWEIVPDSKSGVSFVSTDGDISSGIGGATSRFKIEKSEENSYYNLVYCLPGTQQDVCNGLGIHSDEDGKLFLAWAEELYPIRVVFIKDQLPKLPKNILQA